MNHNTFAFGKGESIGFVNIETGQLEFQYILDESINNRGISCIAGDKTESIFAIGDTFQSRILLFASLNTRCISQLKSINNLSHFNLVKQIEINTIFYHRSINSWVLSTVAVLAKRPFDCIEVPFKQFH